MSVFYKFKSAKDYNSVAIDGHFISVVHLKEKIFELKQLGRGTDFDLVVTNAQTNEEYLDEGMSIPRNTSVLIRRVPGHPRKPIKTYPVSSEQEEPNVETNCGAVKGSSKEFEWDEFGKDVYAIPETVPAHSGILVQDASKEDEESKIKALIDTSALDWQQHQPCTDGKGRACRVGFGRGGMGGRGFGRGFGFENKTPPPGYTCHRCKVAGHFIQHCPTNGDPDFDVRRVKPPTGIPKSMLMATPDGLYALPSGAVAVWKPNEKEIEGMPSTRPVGRLLPPELHCPLCKEVMKDAAFASKCCFTSFCDRCIRDHIISKAMCVCGATNILADDLLPNKTLRDTINRISNSAAGSAFQVQDMESRNPQAKVLSPTQSSKGQKRDETANDVEENKFSNQEKGRSIEVPDVSEGTSVKEGASRRTAPLADEEEAGKEKKKKKLHMPRAQDFPPENYMMPFAPCAFNPYWNDIQPAGLDGFMPPCGGPMPPYMGYGMNVGLSYYPFAGLGCMLPNGPPQPELAMGFINNAGPPTKSRLESEAHKAAAADRKRKREMDQKHELSKDGEYGREGSSSRGYVVSSRSKFKLSADHHRHRSPPERRSRDVELPQKHHHHHHHHHHGHRSNNHPIRSTSKCLLSH